MRTVSTEGEVDNGDRQYRGRQMIVGKSSTQRKQFMVETFSTEGTVDDRDRQYRRGF